MELVKRAFNRLGRWEYIWLCIFVIATLAMHFSIIRIPDQLMFDEQHYMPDARSILQGDGTLRFEHPPLGKLFVVAGIFIFGDNPIGWRIFSVLFGTISLVLFYLVCRRLSMSRLASSLATFLLAFENLFFVQASVVMLDVFSLTFMLASFWFYLKGSYLLAGTIVGLGTLAKLDGALALGVILLHWLFARRDKYRKFIGLMILAPVTFVFLLPLFEYPIFHYFGNPIDRIKTMLTLTASLTFVTVSHGSALRPWDWLLRFATIPYWYKPNYTGAISFSILPLIIPTVLYMIFRVIKYRDAGIFGVSWFTSTYLVWIPAVLITNRVTYPYYFYTTVGAICIGLGLLLTQFIDFWRTRRTGKIRWIAISVAVIYLVIHAGIFAFLSPLSYWWGISLIKSTPAPVTGTPATQTSTSVSVVLRSIFGAVTTIDLEKNQLVVFDITSKKEYTLGVNESTQVIINGQLAVLNAITVNTPVDVTFDEATMLATRIIRSEATPSAQQ